MRFARPATMIAAVLLICAVPAFAQEEAPKTPPIKAAVQPPVTSQPAAKPDMLAVTVNGEKIMESRIDEILDEIIERQARQGRMIPPAQRSMVRANLRPQILKSLVDMALMDQAADKAETKVTDEQLKAEMEKQIGDYLLQSGNTRADFEEMVKNEEKVTLDEFIADRIAQPEFRRAVRHSNFLENKFADELKVTDEAVKAKYDADLARIYDKPAEVKASHILVRVAETASQEEKAAAREKAEKILAEVNKPDADFAKLAAENSDCPSKARGGDLGFFRRAEMVKPFADAAFEMKVGDISDIVESEFGYHIIQLTDRHDAKVVTLEDASDAIRHELVAQKMVDVRNRYLEELKQEAKIEYPEGADKPAMPMMPRPTMPPAAQKPETPQPQTPKAAEPKADEPKAAEPKAEEPKTAEPKTETPATEAPKAEPKQAEGN